jgi:hypothetical protein
MFLPMSTATEPKFPGARCFLRLPPAPSRAPCGAPDCENAMGVPFTIVRAGRADVLSPAGATLGAVAQFQSKPFSPPPTSAKAESAAGAVRLSVSRKVGGSTYYRLAAGQS